MRLYDMKLLTIVCEVLAQRKVYEILEANGIKGYTVYEVRGKGEKGMRGHGIPEENNVKIEVILRAEAAEKIIEEVTRVLFADYALILYLSDVQVARMEKFS